MRRARDPHLDDRGCRERLRAGREVLADVRGPDAEAAQALDEGAVLEVAPAEPCRRSATEPLGSVPCRCAAAARRCVARTEFITRTTASSPGVGDVTPTEASRSGGVMALGSGAGADGERQTEQEHHDAENAAVLRHQGVRRRRVMPESGYVQLQIGNFLQLAADIERFCEKLQFADFRSLRAG